MYGLEFESSMIQFWNPNRRPLFCEAFKIKGLHYLGQVKYDEKAVWMKTDTKGFVYRWIKSSTEDSLINDLLQRIWLDEK